MATLTYAQIRALWLSVGGAPAWADTMTAVALAESQGVTTAINPEACRANAVDCLPCSISNTGDYSIGLWQINYYGSLFADRKKAYGCPADLWDATANARAAKDLLGNGSGATNWTTYRDNAYVPHLAPGSIDMKTGRTTAGGVPGLRGPTGGQATSQGRRTRLGPEGPTDATAKPITLPDAFKRLTYALGATVPTRTHLVDNIAVKLSKAVR